MMKNHRFDIDFNGLIESDLVLLSQLDTKVDENGDEILLFEGMQISIFDHDMNSDGTRNDLIAEGKVEKNRTDIFPHVKWCCRINENGISHERTVS